MDYTKYNIEDFAANESFIHWVHKSDPEAVKFWDLYISEHPEIILRVEHARALVNRLRDIENLAEYQSQEDLIWKKIQERSPVHRSNRSRQFLVLAGLSILIAIIAGIGYFYYSNTTSSGSTYNMALTDFVEQVNNSGKAFTVKLADGSTVRLDNKSRLKYKSSYNTDSTRVVYLEGTAFFDIKKNPYKPFIVHANEVTTKVLGTSFNIAAVPNSENVVVSVKTGKVSVYAEEDIHNNSSTSTDRQGVILYPNQQVSYKKAQHSFEKTLVEAPEIVNHNIAKNDFNFQNASVADVFKVLQNAYGIEIIFNEEALKNCSITAPLGEESLLEKLKIVCQTIGATYEIIDAKVIVTNSGC
ncbi:MAG TPA: FecR family protein [Cyclobacteriaceae bacterium]